MTDARPTGSTTQIPDADIEPLRESHIPGIIALMNLEGWYYYDRHELQRYLQLSEHCLALRQADQVTGSIFSTNYGNQAWLGNIVVAAASRGQGLATTLIQNAISNLKKTNQITTYRLGSVPLAIGLYKKLGFQAESFTTAQEATLPIDIKQTETSLPNSVEVAPLTQDELPAAARLDESYFKSNRLPLLTELYNDSLKASSLSLKDNGQLVGFIMIRRRQESRSQGGFSEGPDDIYRLGPCCVAPAYGIEGFKALFEKAILSVNEEVQSRPGTATMYVVFPRNADKDTIYKDTQDLAMAMGMDDSLDLDDIFDEHDQIFGAARSAKDAAQWQYMAGLGFHQEYFEQVMSCSRGEAGVTSTTQADTEGIFATATPGDKA